MQKFDESSFFLLALTAFGFFLTLSLSLSLSFPSSQAANAQLFLTKASTSTPFCAEKSESLGYSGLRGAHLLAGFLFSPPPLPYAAPSRYMLCIDHHTIETKERTNTD